MGWWGKVLGGAFGYMLGGPLGALIGAALGHNLDAGLRRVGELPPGRGRLDERERTQTAFFTASFSVMGHIAKADGQVSDREIKLARGVMDQMALSSELRKVARRLFAEGKAPDFPLDAVLEQFRRECRRHHNLLRIFVEIQLQAAYADGVVHPAERRILEHVCERLRIAPGELEQLEAMLRAEAHWRGSGGGAEPPTGPSLEDAHAILGVDRGVTDAEVKKAYRRLMSQHHPDKLVANGLPEEMMKVATEKTREIRAAYEQVMASRKR